MSDTPVVERMDSAVFTLSTDVAETDGALTVKRMGDRVVRSGAFGWRMTFVQPSSRASKCR